MRQATTHQTITPQAITATQQAITNVFRNFAAACFLALGLWFLMRRFAGAFPRPLTLAEISVCGGLLVVASALISLWSLGPDGAGHRGAADRWPRIVVLLSVGCFGVALSLTGTSYVSLGCFWTLLLVAISVPAVGLVRQRSDLSARKSTVIRARGTVRGQSVRFAPSWPTATVAETARLAKDSANGEITQQMTRETLAVDHERVRGVLRVSFAPGQRLAVVHAGFCPPLSRLPSIEVTQVDGPLATVNPSQVLPYGVGFDVRLSESPSAAETVKIAFMALT